MLDLMSLAERIKAETKEDWFAHFEVPHVEG